MSVKIRLKRLGRKGAPFYHVVVADSRKATGGRFLEQVGHYDPAPALSKIELKIDRIAHFLSHGAQLSGAVKALLKAQKISPAALLNKG